MIHLRHLPSTLNFPRTAQLAPFATLATRAACYVVFALATGCAASSEAPDPQPGATMQVTSTAFAHGAALPQKFTGDGQDVSPPLHWDGAPGATKSIALICDDPDAPRGTWVHWVVWNLPADQHDLAEGVPASATLPGGACQGKNDFGKIGYGGPAPPSGKPHRYFFKVYALDQKLDLPEGATKAQLEQAMKGHLLASGQLMGTYAR